jgi:hypothetical protein
MTSLGGARHKSGADPWSAAWSAADPLVRSRPPGPQPTPWSAAPLPGGRKNVSAYPLLHTADLDMMNSYKEVVCVYSAWRIP